MSVRKRHDLDQSGIYTAEICEDLLCQEKDRIFFCRGPRFNRIDAVLIYKRLLALVGQKFGNDIIVIRPFLQTGMGTREKDEIHFYKLIGRIKIPHHQRTPLIIDQPGVINHREFKEINGEGRIDTLVFLAGKSGTNIQSHIYAVL